MSIPLYRDTFHSDIIFCLLKKFKKNISSRGSQLEILFQPSVCKIFYFALKF